MAGGAVVSQVVSQVVGGSCWHEAYSGPTRPSWSVELLPRHLALSLPPHTHQLPLEARPSPGCTGHLLWGTLRPPVFC